MAKIKQWFKKHKTFRSKIASIYQWFNIFWAKNILSDEVEIIGNPVFRVPTIFKGKGKFIFGGNNNFGGDTSPDFYQPNYLEARNPNTTIEFAKHIFVNNNLTIIAEGEGDEGGVFIDDDTMFGFNVTIMDSNFHDIDPNKRWLLPNSKEGGVRVKSAKVVIGKNCWIGSNSMILKGVHLGENSIVGAGSVVTKSFPKNVIVAGNPAKIIATLDKYLKEQNQDEKMDSCIR